MNDTSRFMSVYKYYDRQGMLDCKWEKEASLLDYSIECCKMLGAVPVRMAFTTEKGQSDLIICHNGRFYAAELKVRTGTPSAQQLKFIEKIKAAGGHSAVIYTLRDLLTLFMQ